MRVGITGHRGMPEELAELVKTALREIVGGYPAADLVGVSCIADGPDAWFAQAVLDHGGKLEIVVPARKYRESLPEWHHAAYDGLLRRASEVHETGLSESDSHAHMAGSELLVGLADQLVAVWDGQPARGYGGTADVVGYAERTGVPGTGRVAAGREPRLTRASCAGHAPYGSVIGDQLPRGWAV